MHLNQICMNFCRESVQLLTRLVYSKYWNNTELILLLSCYLSLIVVFVLLLILSSAESSLCCVECQSVCVVLFLWFGYCLLRKASETAVYYTYNCTKTVFCWYLLVIVINFKLRTRNVGRGPTWTVAASC